MRNLLLAATLSFLALLPQSQQPDISKIAAKDSHQNFVVAADPCTDAARIKQVFDKIDPSKAGLLAVDIYFQNNTEYPVHVELTTIRLDVDGPHNQRFHLPSLSLKEAATEIAHPNGPSAPHPSRLPPIISGGDRKERDAENVLQPLMIQSDVVPPGKTIHGFVFFDMNHQFDLAPYSSVYVPDVQSIASSDPMIYFEVPLGLHHPD
jgi:hypothetical protein